jgi:hypothetical protein
MKWTHFDWKAFVYVIATSSCRQLGLSDGDSMFFAVHCDVFEFFTIFRDENVSYYNSVITAGFTE